MKLMNIKKSKIYFMTLKRWRRWTYLHLFCPIVYLYLSYVSFMFFPLPLHHNINGALHKVNELRRRNEEEVFFWLPLKNKFSVPFYANSDLLLNRLWILFYCFLLLPTSFFSPLVQWKSWLKQQGMSVRWLNFLLPVSISCEHERE